ncbi:MAG: thiamine pyrophosphate-binding protein [Chloroflexi bacterium]|jgi:acetolactate synthase-1/2/3 large subunit|nr:thiamine pyrophosphate-binding protein [Chloroflexota bacterium]MQG53989.1 thiamine pyrophosphate-binding protein [SAR202 cluster bacterium]|tara:strand:- start:26959 stop:28611 length:1653 start_codon:yes stop_codon:yes gene_type:complete
MMAQMTGAQALTRSLVREGVEVVFALPGVQIMEAFNALYDEPSIRLVLVRHEQSAAYMADGYSRTTGKPGVAMVVPGPGALNATAAVGTAFASSSPIMLISGQIESFNLGVNRGALHEIGEQLDVFKHLTKWCARTTESSEIPNLVHQAMEQLTTGRPRPVEIEIPWDILPDQTEIKLFEKEVHPKTRPEPGAVREAADALAHAERPLIWAGGGAREADLSHELLELAQALNAPVITTPEGKGSFPEDNPLSLGTIYNGHGPGHHAVPQADVILAIGSRMHMVPPVDWSPQSHQKLIQIDADPEEVGRNIPVTTGMAADGRLALQDLLAELGGKTRASRWTQGDIDTIRDATMAEIQAIAPLQVEIINTIRQELDDDAIMVAGTTEIGYWSHLAFPALSPRSYLTSSYFATLGYAFPTALGAKIGNPYRQVVATSGDGGFGYASSELATAVQEGINVVTIVFNNESFGASYADQENRYKARFIGTQIHNPNYAKLAESYGALGTKVSGPQELGPALRDALKADRPALIEVPIPNLVPPFQISPPGIIKRS